MYIHVIQLDGEEICNYFLLSPNDHRKQMSQSRRNHLSKLRTVLKPVSNDSSLYCIKMS